MAPQVPEPHLGVLSLRCPAGQLGPYVHYLGPVPEGGLSSSVRGEPRDRSGVTGREMVLKPPFMILGGLSVLWGPGSG